jgi:adenine-specific DNA-methyltransferase
MIKYLGSKRTLIPHILKAIGTTPLRVLDVFSGTARVARACKVAGHQVIANDHNAYAATLARAYVQADRHRHHHAAVELVAELNATLPKPGYVTDRFCTKARFFTPENGARIDAVRDRIATMKLDDELEAIALVSLMEAADRVDSTCGVQMAYLKKWAARALQPMVLRVPELSDASRGVCMATQQEASLAVASHEVDVAYLDPPYNQHSYLGNYHIWETLVRWDQPETYGVAQKRIDCKTRKSAFNGKRSMYQALAEVIGQVQAKVILVSFSNEGYLRRDELEGLLSSRGAVTIEDHDYPRYVGARIGVFNPQGERVGQVSHVRNVEHLYRVAVTTDATTA